MTEPPQPPTNPDDPYHAGGPPVPHDPGPGQFPPPADYPQYPTGQYQQGGYPQGGYQQGGYSPQPGYPQPGPSAGGLRLAERLGARTARRPEARFGISLAAGGVVLTIIGVLVWGVGYLASGLHITLGLDGEGAPTAHGEARRFLGAGLALVVVVVGYALVIVRRRGPLATAGAVAGAIGIPVMIIFLSLDIEGIFRGQFPISIDAVYLVSILAWLISYLAVPGAQGRAFYLGLVALNFASYIGFKTGQDALLSTAVSSVDNGGLPSSGPSTGSLAAVGLLFGLAYYAVAAFLDRRGRAGAAVALVVAGFFVTVSGVIAAIPSFHQVGTGVLLIALGAALGWYGGHFGRRFTAWAWTAGLVLGIGLIVQRVIPHSASGAGIVLIAIGAAVVVAAQLVSTLTGEAPDIEDVMVATDRAPAPTG